jgi:hypothetical protein
MVDAIVAFTIAFMAAMATLVQLLLLLQLLPLLLLLVLLAALLHQSARLQLPVFLTLLLASPQISYSLLEWWP